MQPILIFDLDDTLIDRERAFSRWVNDWTDHRGLGPTAQEWILAADADSDRPRLGLFEAIVEHFGLPASAEELVDEFYREFPTYFEPDPVVHDGLSQLRSNGWKIGVATNGSRAQRPKMEAANLFGLVDGVCVSRELGTAKPDPGIFHAVADAAEATLAGGWMIGDSPSSDIAGGAGVGLRTIWIARGRRWPLTGIVPESTVERVGEALDLLGALGSVDSGTK